MSVIKDNQTLTVRARKEVILSAGAVMSPQILMLSGIGPKTHLEDAGVSCLFFLLSCLKMKYWIHFYLKVNGSLIEGP